MKEIVLEVKKRDTGKKNSKAVRNDGYVPGVYYARGDQNISIMAKPAALRPIVYTAQTRVVDLKVEGDSEIYQCILKDAVFDPVSDELTHFDLQGLKPGQKLTVDLPLKFVGQPIGVRLGGKMMQNMHKIKVKCLPKDIVESIDIEITNLNMGDYIYLRDLNLENLEVELPEDTVIVSVLKPRGGAEVK